MILHEKRYYDFIISKGVGRNDRVASSPDSYISYLRSVSRILSMDITPSSLRSEADVIDIGEQIRGKRKVADRTINNYKSAMRQYVAFVLENRLSASLITK